MADLSADDKQFHGYFRMNKKQFEQILLAVEPSLRSRMNRRETINPRQQLAITLRFLATGESYHSLFYTYRVGVTTISRIIPRVCDVIWDKLGDAMKMPTSSDEWKEIANSFEKKWDFPHAVGAVDGKHVVMKAPSNSGSRFFNYKGTFSVVLMAVVDANYKFICISVGAEGRYSDGGIFAASNFGKSLMCGSLALPLDEKIENSAAGDLPYVFVGDEAFPLLPNLMRPFPGRNLDESKRVFNYRLSRARRVVENAFGILAQRWRVFHTKMALNELHAKKVIKACCLLHNILVQDRLNCDVSSLMTEIIEDGPAQQGLTSLRATGNHASLRAVNVREQYCHYFCNEAPLPWQLSHVRQGSF